MQNGSNTIDDLLKQATDSGDVPGVVALITNEDRDIYSGASGYRDPTTKQALEVDSVFWIASMTKAITCAAAMQLVEQGRLALDAPIGDVLSELKNPEVLTGFDGEGNPILRPAKGAITLRQLMTHTSGHSYEMWNEDILRFQQARGLPGIISCENAALRMPLVSDPGTKWEYSIAIDFVGKAIEAVSGQSLGAYLRDRIFAPLCMTDTSFVLSPEQRRRLVTMNARSDSGKLDPIAFEVPQQPEFEMGGGGLYGTAGDYAKFIRMILNKGWSNGYQILKPETVEQMSRNNMHDLCMSKLSTVMPASSNDVDFYPDQEKKWGLSFMINSQRTAEGRNAGSLAWAGLANTFFWIDPAARIGGVVMTQILPFVDPAALNLYHAVERAAYESIAAGGTF